MRDEIDETKNILFEGKKRNLNLDRIAGAVASSCGVAA